METFVRKNILNDKFKIDSLTFQKSWEAYPRRNITSI